MSSWWCPACLRGIEALGPGPDGRPDAACPHCGALERHRVLAWLLDRLAPLISTSRALLDVAPERRAMFPSYALAYPVGKFLRSATEKDDTVFVAGNNPTVYWVASRRAPTRFFAEYALVEPSYREERRRQLFARPPGALVIFPGGSIFGGEARELVARLPYRQAYEREGARVWLLDER